MAIEFRCTKCNKLLRTADDTAGKHAKCPECGEILLIPTTDVFSTPPAAGGSGATPPSSDPAGGNVSEVGPQPPYQPDGGNPYQSRSPFALPNKPMREIRPTIIDVGNVMARAWAIFKEEWAMCLGAAVVAGICSMLFGFLISAVFNSVFGIAIDLRSLFTGDPSKFTEDLLHLAVHAQIENFISLFFNVWIYSGVCIVMLKIARGQQASIGDIFGGGRYYATMLAIALIFQVLIAIGNFFLVIPGFILSMIWLQYSCLIVDCDAGITESWNLFSQITKGNIMAQILLGLLSFAIFLLGLLACCVGLLVAVPFVALLNAVIYLSMAGQPTVDQLRGGIPR